MKAVFTRRSIRKYTSQPVSDEIVKDLLKAGMSAPSAMNQRPWHFVVIKDKEIFNQIASIHPYAQMLKGASVAILVCGHSQNEMYKDFLAQDCSAAVENILIEAEDQGLGAVWVGVFPNEDRIKGLRTLLNIPDEVFPFALISIGYPAEEKPYVDRYEEKKVHYNKW